MTTLRKYLSEIFGTFTLVFIGCGSAVFLGAESSGGHLAVAFAFGLAVVAMAYAIGSVSGCHVNPAVSLAMLLQKKLSFTDFIGYVASQVIGAIAGARLLDWLSRLQGLDETGTLGSNAAGDLGIAGALVVEVVLTFIFIFTILRVTSDEKKGSVAGLIIGLTLTLVHIIGIPLTGTSVNPARSLGPALLAGGTALSDLWLFILAPLAGAVLASFAHTFLESKKS